jgi:hypothetical protein
MKKENIIELMNALSGHNFKELVFKVDGLVDSASPEVSIIGESYLVDCHFVNNRAIFSVTLNDENGEASKVWLNAVWKTLLHNRNSKDCSVLKATAAFDRRMISQKKAALQMPKSKKRRFRFQNLIKNRFYVSEDTGIKLLRNYKNEAF